ncbi:hypothetical protein [Methylobacterium durans]|uniref:hypothetical protein n=1 Tax=Methylobacterium durans TaxID=2202825 RepID=UPI0013A53DF8|nr:hypothetical protein [Methylobacterium durans]
MNKIELLLSDEEFNILAKQLESELGPVEKNIQLDFANIYNDKFKLSYATDHGPNVLALLQVASTSSLPGSLQEKHAEG